MPVMLIFLLTFKTSLIFVAIIDLIFFFINSFLTLQTKEKLFLEKGSIAKGPSFKKN